MGPAFQILLGFLAYSCLWQDTDALNCPPGWARVDKYCYGFYDSQKTWPEAEKFCTTFKGGHLASIHSEFDRDKLARFLLSKPNSNGHIWIGLNSIQPGSNGAWRWSDGSKFDYKSWNTLEGEPNNFMGSEHCTEIHTVDMWYWNDIDCAKKNRMVCKTSPY